MSELQKIELKVSVGCCDACRRKVKKQLQGIEGVCRTEIDGETGEVVVHGNADPQILISRLSRMGKQAQLVSSGKYQNAEKEKKEEKPAPTKEERPKPKNPSSSKSDNNEPKENISWNIKAEKASMKDDNKENNNDIRLPDVEILKKETPVPTPEVKIMPYLVPIPYYAMPQYAVSLPQTIYSQGCYLQQEMPVYVHQPQQVTRFGDYFSDENTAGCNVM